MWTGVARSYQDLLDLFGDGTSPPQNRELRDVVATFAANRFGTAIAAELPPYNVSSLASAAANTANLIAALAAGSSTLLTPGTYAVTDTFPTYANGVVLSLGRSVFLSVGGLRASPITLAPILRFDNPPQALTSSTLSGLGDSISAGFNPVGPTDYVVGAAGTYRAFFDSWVWWAGLYSSGTLVMIGDSAQSSQFTDDQIVNYATRIRQYRPVYVLDNVGFNDIYSAVDGTIDAILATLKQRKQYLWNMLRSDGVIPIIATIFPNRTAYPSSTTKIRQRHHYFNNWLRDQRYNGLLVFDSANLVTDPANVNGEPVAAFNQAGGTSHPPVEYRRLIGQALWKFMQPLLLANTISSDGSPRTRNILGTHLLYTDPLMQTTGGTVTGLAGGSVLPTGWSNQGFTTECTTSIVAADDGFGKAVRVSVDTTAIGTTHKGLAISCNKTGIVAGDIIKCRYRINHGTISSCQGMRATLQVGGTVSSVSGNSFCQVMDPTGSAYPGTALSTTYVGLMEMPPLVIPSGMDTISNIILWFDFFFVGNAAATNVIDISGVEIYRANSPFP